MADLFFSYSAKDRARVLPAYEALTALGFEVCWDQQIPASSNWDTWIREQLAAARCVIVFWSPQSAASPSVFHEATIARNQGKLIPVMLDPLRDEQIPIGHLDQQAARLIEWSGDREHPEWKKLLTEIESRLTPLWAARRIARLDAELKAERRRRDSLTANDDAAAAQLDEEIAKQDLLRAELDAVRTQNRAMAERIARTEEAGRSGRTRARFLALTLGVLLAAALAGAAFSLTQQAALRQTAGELQRRVDTQARELAETVAKLEQSEAARAKAEQQLRQSAERETELTRDLERLRLEAAANARDAQAARAIVNERKQRVPRPNVAINGRLIAPNPSVSNAQGCRDACASDLRCNGYEFNSGQYCWMYSTIREDYAKDTSVSDRWDVEAQPSLWQRLNPSETPRSRTTR